MTVRSTNGTRWSDPIETPAPVAQVETDWSGWEEWLQSHLAIERTENGKIFDDIYEGFKGFEFTRSDLYKGLERLEREVAELRGAMNVMRSLGHAGLRLRGAFDAAAEYLAHDVVVRNGSSFVALRDRPGACPGEHWQLVASKGNRGERGVPGPRGQVGGRGEPAPTIKTWLVDKTKFTASPVLSDGTVGAALELKGLFQEFLDQTRAGA